MTETQILTGKVRFSFVNVFKPKSNNDGTEKYSVTLLIPKSDKKTLGKIKAAIEAAKAVYGSTNPKKLPPSKTTLHDGDGVRPSDGEPFGPECKGCMVITVSSNNKPIVVDANRMPILDQSEVYSGCYGKAIINFYCYEYSGNRGITAGLNAIMKTDDGEPLTASVIQESDWEDDSDYDDMLD